MLIGVRGMSPIGVIGVRGVYADRIEGDMLLRGTVSNKHVRGTVSNKHVTPNIAGPTCIPLNWTSSLINLPRSRTHF